MGIILRWGLLLFIFSGFQVRAQSTGKTQIREGRNFSEYQIPKGKTLYSLSKETGVPQDTLVHFNPALAQGLKTGMLIWIPGALVPSPTPVESGKSAFRHEVKAGETLFGIAKKYALSVDELKKQNPQAAEGLQPGTILLVYPKPGMRPEKSDNTASEQAAEQQTEPQPKENSSPVATSPCAGVKANRASYKVKAALMLPFYAASGEENASKARIGLDFFAGAKLALDSLEKAGYQLDVHVFDTQADSNQIERLIQSGDLASMDIIIGPLYASDFKAVAQYARAKGIIAISPFSQSDAILESNPQAVKVSPDQKRLVQGACEFLSSELKYAEFWVIRNANAKDQDLVNAALESLKAKEGIKVEEVTYSGAGDLLAKMDESKEYVLVFPTTVQIQVIDVLNRLNSGRLGKRMILVGLPEWNNYENIEFDFLNNLRFTYPSVSHTDYTSPASLRFQRMYREEFKGEAGNYAYQGYDITQYFMRLLGDYGKLPTECIPSVPPYCGFASCFEFRQSGQGNGYENQFVNVLRLEDFKAVRLNKP